MLEGSERLHYAIASISWKKENWLMPYCAQVAVNLPMMQIIFVGIS